MNETNTTQTTEFVWRRLTEPLRLFGWELNPRLWLVLLVLLLLAGFFYIGWMYLRDSRGVGPWWAILLGLLRAAVYTVLAVVFLLPSEQTWEETGRSTTRTAPSSRGPPATPCLPSSGAPGFGPP